MRRKREQPAEKGRTVSGEPLNSVKRFEKLLRRKAARSRYALRLYITGATEGSTRAVTAIRSFCEEHLKDRYDLEVVDIYQNPDEARDEQIIAAPTLVKERPVPPKRMVGNLCDTEKIFAGLDLRREPPGKKK